jgi:hypothetical protein
MPAPRHLILPLALLALAGCDQAKETAGAGRAQGQILPGSASDAMIPLDTVRSQAPLATNSGDGGEEGTEPREKEKASPKAPAARPSPAATSAAASEPED